MRASVIKKYTKLMITNRTFQKNKSSEQILMYDQTANIKWPNEINPLRQSEPYSPEGDKNDRKIKIWPVWNTTSW